MAARLLKENSTLDVAVIEPSEKHYYQLAFTLVGGGVYNKNKTERSEASVMPKGVTWIKAAVASFDADNNSLATADGTTYSYDYLVAAPGIQLNWGAVEGLKETIGKNNLCSNYSFQNAPLHLGNSKKLQRRNRNIYESRNSRQMWWSASKGDLHVIRLF